MIKIAKILFLLYVFAISVSGCGINDKDRRAIVVLLDYSASSSNEVLDEYIRIINEEIVSNMKQYDCLTIMPIDEGSIRQPVKIIYEDLIEKKFIGKDGFAHAQDSLNMRMVKYMTEIKPKITKTLYNERIKRREYTQYTDIIGAMQQVPDLIELKRKTNAWKESWNFVVGKTTYKSDNILVILSDMIQDSREFTLNTKRGISEKRSSFYLNQLVKGKKIPDLNNCKVFAIGSTGRNTIQIDNNTAFWKEYFKLTHGELRAYGYDVEDKLRKYLNGIEN